MIKICVQCENLRGRLKHFQWIILFSIYFYDTDLINIFKKNALIY